MEYGIWDFIESVIPSNVFIVRMKGSNLFYIKDLTYVVNFGFDTFLAIHKNYKRVLFLSSSANTNIQQVLSILWHTAWSSPAQLFCTIHGRGCRNRTYANGFGDRRTTTIRIP